MYSVLSYDLRMKLRCLQYVRKSAECQSAASCSVGSQGWGLRYKSVRKPNLCLKSSVHTCEHRASFSSFSASAPGVNHTVSTLIYVMAVRKQATLGFVYALQRQVLFLTIVTTEDFWIAGRLVSRPNQSSLLQPSIRQWARRRNPQVKRKVMWELIMQRGRHLMELSEALPRNKTLAISLLPIP